MIKQAFYRVIDFEFDINISVGCFVIKFFAFDMHDEIMILNAF